MKVALDVDDVIANFYQAACEWCEVEFIPRNHWGSETEEFIIPAWEYMKKDEEFWYNLEKLNDVDFDFDCYITSLPDHLKDNRLDWLNRNGFPEKPIFFAHDKLKVAEEIGVDVIIDDKPSTIEQFIEGGKHAIHYLPPYTTLKPKSPYFTRDFSEIPKILETIKNKHYVGQTG